MPSVPRRAHVFSRGLWEMQISVPYPKAIRCGEMVFTCGQCDLDEHGRPLRPGDLRAQTDQTMAYAYQVLAEAGAGPADLVRLQVFYANDGDVDEDSYRRHIAAIVRASGSRDAVIVMSPLPHFYYPGMAVEIDAVAMVGAAPHNAISPPSWIDTPLTEALRAGEMIFITAEPRDASGAVLHPGQIERQTHAVIDSIESSLAAFGADKGDLVKLSFAFEGGEAVWHALAAARASRFPEPGPVVTDLSLQNLAPAGTSVKVEAVAMRGLDDRRLPKDHLYPDAHWRWPLAQPFSQAIRCHDKVFIGAQLPLDRHGRAAAPGDVESQTKSAMGSLGTLLDRFGLGFEHVVKANTFYVGGPNPDDLHRNMVVRNRYYARPGPASTGVPVRHLAIPGATVAIEAFAMTDVAV
ncbi:MAG: RidA family protein [Alphaproteobacteria bacterium]